MKIYKSIETLPIWNYHKIQSSNDLRFLLIIDDYYDLPGVDNELFLNLKIIWRTIIAELPSMDLTIQRAYLRALNALYSYRMKGGNLQKVNSTFADYRTKLDNIYKTYEYKGVKYRSSLDVYNTIKEQIPEFDKLLYVRLKELDYRTIQGTYFNTSDINKTINALSKYYGYNIDEKKISVARYYAMLNEYNEYVKAQKKLNGRKNRI